MRRSEDSDSSEARRGEGSPLGRERERAQLVLLGAESVLAFVFWCIFTELIPTVWFWPLNAMKATGEEFLYLLAYASPLLLLVPSLRLATSTARPLFYLAMMVGILAYMMPSLRSRSMAVSFATAVGTLVHFTPFWSSNQRRERGLWALLLGLFLFSSSRFAFATLTPLWLSSSTTIMGLITSLFSILVVFLYEGEATSRPVIDLEAAQVRLEKEETSNAPPPGQQPSITDSLLHGLGLGLLLHLTHWVLSTHSVVPRWIEVDPFPAGFGFFIAFVVGLILSSDNAISRSWYFYVAAVVSTYLIFTFTPSISIFFFYFLVVYLIAIWAPLVADLSQRSRLPLALSVALLVYVLGQLAIIWSVAFNFVPPGTGGPFMKERAYQVFFLCVALLGLGYRKVAPKHSVFRLPSGEVTQLILIILLLVTVPAFIKRSSNWANFDGNNNVARDHIRGAMWAIRFGYNNRGWPNFFDVKNKLTEVGANVIGLVETDTTRPFLGNRDIVEYLQDQLHMYSDYGPSTVNETWGCAMLSVFPIVRAEHGQMPSPDGEIACYIDSTLLVNGALIDVMVAHVGNTEHVRDRKLQAEFMAAKAKEKKAKNRRTIWLGYLTDKPNGPNYQKMIAGGFVDVSPQEQDRYCLYLFHMGMQPRDYKRVRVDLEKEGISDTEIMMADFY